MANGATYTAQEGTALSVESSSPVQAGGSCRQCNKRGRSVGTAAVPEPRPPSSDLCFVPAFGRGAALANLSIRAAARGGLSPSRQCPHRTPAEELKPAPPVLFLGARCHVPHGTPAEELKPAVRGVQRCAVCRLTGPASSGWALPLGARCRVPHGTPAERALSLRALRNVPHRTPAESRGRYRRPSASGLCAVSPTGHRPRG